MSDDFDLLDRHLYYLTHDLERSNNTVSTYKMFLSRFFEYIEGIGDDSLSVGISHVMDFCEFEAKKQHLSKASRHPLIAAIKGYFNWLKDKEYRVDNPADNVRYPVKQRRLPVPMSNDNAELLFDQIDLDSFKGVRDAAIIAMFFGTGMRLGGLTGLNESSLSVVDADSEQQFVVRTIEKGNKEHLKPMPVGSVMYLKLYLGHEDLQGIDRELPNGDKVLFVSTGNRQVAAEDYVGEKRRLSERGVQDMIATYGEKAGIPRNQCHPHALRHSFGTELVEDDVDLRTVQEMLDHARLDTTAIYIHVAFRKTMRIVNESSPMAKIRTPITDLVEILQK